MLASSETTRSDGCSTVSHGKVHGVYILSSLATRGFLKKRRGIIIVILVILTAACLLCLTSIRDTNNSTDTTTVICDTKTTSTTTSVAVARSAITKTSNFTSNNSTTTLTVTGHSSKIYGLVHMAKTAGTAINGILALKYERVCGNKGSSYNFEQINYVNKIAKQKVSCCLGEITFKQQLLEIGFQNCDYIVIEDHYKRWLNKLGHIQNLELHVPCRSNMIENLMSIANYKGRMKFNCTAATEATDVAASSDNDNKNYYYSQDVIDSEVSKIVSWYDRFDYSLVQHSNFTVKCFNPIPVENYIMYMNQHLQPKRGSEEQDYVERNSNHFRKRHKENECIWKDSKLQELVKQSMIKQYQYYHFCNQCMGSNNELKFE